MSSLFILIRNDLKSESYKAVQAGHAVAQFMMDHPSSDWKNSYLIYVTVDNEQELRRWEFKLRLKGLATTSFFEPDLGDQMTALACHTSDRKTFGKLKLL